MKRIEHMFEPEKPDALVERYGAELERMAAPLMVPLTGSLRPVVDLANALALLERAIHEAWVQGGAYNLAMARPQKIVLEPGSSEMTGALMEMLRKDIRDQGGES